jgi:hypothetical protein
VGGVELCTVLNMALTREADISLMFEPLMLITSSSSRSDALRMQQ